MRLFRDSHATYGLAWMSQVARLQAAAGVLRVRKQCLGCSWLGKQLDAVWWLAMRVACSESAAAAAGVGPVCCCSLCAWPPFTQTARPFGHAAPRAPLRAANGYIAALIGGWGSVLVEAAAKQTLEETAVNALTLLPRHPPPTHPHPNRTKPRQAAAGAPRHHRRG